MHKIRAHGKGWDTSGNFHRGGEKGSTKGQTEEQKQARRRVYQRRLRERYKLQGKNSRGYLRNPAIDPRKWTPARTRRFQATMRRKAMQKAGAQMFEAGGKKPKRIQIVYPEPVNPMKHLVEQEPVAVIPYLKYCPNCGEHLEGWKHV
jgi:hypothetical protein